MNVTIRSKIKAFLLNHIGFYLFKEILKQYKGFYDRAFAGAIAAGEQCNGGKANSAAILMVKYSEILYGKFGLHRLYFSFTPQR